MSKLKSHLKDTGQTIRSFALRLEISESYLSEIAAKKKVPGLQLAHDIANLTGGVIPMTHWLEDDVSADNGGNKVSPTAIPITTPCPEGKKHA